MRRDLAEIVRDNRALLIRRARRRLREQVSPELLSPGRARALFEQRMSRVLRDIEGDGPIVLEDADPDTRVDAALEVDLSLRNAILELIDDNFPDDAEAELRHRKRVTKLFDAYMRERLRFYGEHGSGLATELSRFQAELRRKTTLTSGLLRGSQHGVVVMDGNGRIVSWNEAAVLVMRRAEEAMLGMHGQEAFPEIASAIDDFLATRDTGVQKGEFSVRVVNGKDDDEMTIYYHLTAIEGEREAWTPHLILSLWDVSELNTLKARLDEAEKLAAMSRIAGSVAHEIRNPLNSIFLNSDLLEREVTKDATMNADKIRRYVDRVREEVERLNDIIADYLSLARLADLRRQTADLMRVIGDFVSELRARWRGAKIRIVEELDDPLPPVSFDERQMRRVLLNLATNAREAMPDGGVLTFAAALRDRGVEVSVRDTGPGMDVEALKRATEPFFTRKEGGTGLGLYLVQEIIRAHGGELRIESRPRDGVKVTFGLPIAEVVEVSETTEDEDLASDERQRPAENTSRR